MNRLPILDVLGRDLRYAVRMLRKTPTFTVTAVVTLALVIGACTAVFSLADAILLRPLPYPEPERLALIEGSATTPNGVFLTTSVDGAMWEAVRDHATLVDAAVYSPASDSANLVVNGAAAFVQQHRVSSGFFRVLGVRPERGSEFTPQQDVASGPTVTVLSHDLWRRMFQSDPEIIGKAILLRGEPYTVVGVMPAGFRSVFGADLWTPLRGSSKGEGSGTNFRIAVRLESDATWDQARAQLKTLGGEAFRILRTPKGVTSELGVKPMQAALVAGVRDPIVMLAWAVAAVLVMACVNLAALLLARGGSRAKEIATRMALGSGRRAVIRQLMVEALVLAIAGGALGVLIGALGLDALKALGGNTFEEWTRVTLDGRVLVATLGLSLLTSLLFGLVPAWQASRLNVQAALADGGSRSVAGSARHWPRRLLVVTEVALGVVLLVTAGLLLRTFLNLWNLEPGFDPRNLVTASVSLQDARYTSAAKINQLFDDSLRRLRETPGVQSAGVSLELPYDRLLNRAFRFPEADPSAQSWMTNSAYITPGFLSTLGIAVRAGRDIGETDTVASPPVVLVNETFVRIYSRDRDPISRRIRIAGSEREIVGVTGDVQQRRSLSMDGIAPGPITSLPIVFVPASQTADGDFRMSHTWFTPVWSVRARSTADGARAIRQAIGGVDPLLPISGQRQMTEVMAAAMAQQRLLMTLVGVLATAAILLAALGLHGLIAHSVNDRRREFGIRLALGAAPAQTVRNVAFGGILLAAAGATAGLALSVPAVRLVQSSLVGVTERDPITYVGVAAFLLVVASIASLIPALRILKLNPVETLRG
jgi:predicted permease